MKKLIIILLLIVSFSGKGQETFWSQNTSVPAEFIMEFVMGAGETLTIPLYNTTGYNGTIDWGDGSALSTITTYNDADLAHQYTNAGTYDVKLLGTYKGIYFNNGGSCAKLTKIIQWGNVGFTMFQYAFYGCTNLNSLPSGSITGAVNVTTTGFNETFHNCTSLTTIPTDLFRLCVNVTTLAFNGTFYGCTGITTIPTDLFRYNTVVTTQAFYYTFRDCTSLTTIPTDLFRYNTTASIYVFTGTFRGCTSLATIPTDLFRYNTAVTTDAFNGTFLGCTKLETIPDLTFKYNTNVSGSCWRNCFNNCPKLQLNAKIFYDTNEQSTRFLNKVMNFSEGCFSRTTFTGTQGTAPDLWNCDYGESITLDVAPVIDWAADDIITGQTSAAVATVISKTSTLVYHIKKHFGTFTLGEIIGVTGNANKLADQGAANPTFSGTPVSTSCFSGNGNSATSLTNYNDIPTDWK